MGWRSRSFLLLAGAGGTSALLYLVNFRLASLLDHLGIIDPKGGALAVYPYLFFPQGPSRTWSLRTAARDGPWG